MGSFWVTGVKRSFSTKMSLCCRNMSLSPFNIVCLFYSCICINLGPIIAIMVNLGYFLPAVLAILSIFCFVFVHFFLNSVSLFKWCLKTSFETFHWSYQDKLHRLWVNALTNFEFVIKSTVMCLHHIIFLISIRVDWVSNFNESWIDLITTFLKIGMQFLI